MLESNHFNAVSDPMLACPCCGHGGPSVALLIVVESIRKHFNSPVTILSCARCRKHNATLRGAAEHSLHIVESEDDVSEAADIRVRGITTDEVNNFLMQSGYANLLGIGLYANGRIHVDVRGHTARWDMRTDQ